MRDEHIPFIIKAVGILTAVWMHNVHVLPVIDATCRKIGVYGSCQCLLPSAKMIGVTEKLT